MKKIPTLFERTFENHRIVGITDKITPGCEDAFKRGRATVKFDGSCCAIINGELYKRYDAKKGKKAPEGAIPCCDPDPVTGHHPHWVKCSEDDPSDKWFIEAFRKHLFDLGRRGYPVSDGTYEAVGPHFNGDPYGLSRDYLLRHGVEEIFVDLTTFDDVKKYLTETEVEGIVFWLDGNPVCKIKRTDFGLPWPVKREE